MWVSSHVFCEKKNNMIPNSLLDPSRLLDKPIFIQLASNLTLYLLGESAHNSCVFLQVGITKDILIYRKNEHFGLKLLFAVINH